VSRSTSVRLAGTRPHIVPGFPGDRVLPRSRRAPPALLSSGSSGNVPGRSDRRHPRETRFSGKAAHPGSHERPWYRPAPFCPTVPSAKIDNRKRSGRSPDAVRIGAVASTRPASERHR
jgi:hypothetical protein